MVWKTFGTRNPEKIARRSILLIRLTYAMKVIQGKGVEEERGWADRSRKGKDYLITGPLHAKTTENSHKTEFSTLWKHFFHCAWKTVKARLTVSIAYEMR